MADKLDELLGAVQQHIKDRKAELQAAETQLRALRSAQDDINKHIADKHDELSALQAELGKSNEKLREASAKAEGTVAGIIEEAHKVRDEAEAKAKKRLDEAANILNDAQAKAADLDKAAKAKAKELQRTTEELNAVQSQLAALRAQARQFADGC